MTVKILDGLNVTTMPVRSNEILVLTFDPERIPEEKASAIFTYVKEQFPDNKVLSLLEGSELRPLT